MLSVIIPTLNEAAYLPGLLTILLAQLPKGSQIIVSDGTSNDDTVAIARSHGCQVVVSKYRSPAKQRNAGARIAKGDILFFLDADTRFSETVIQDSIRTFTVKKFDVASFYFRFDSPEVRYGILFWYGTLLIYLLHFFHPVALGAAILVKRTWFDKVGGFDEKQFVGEDHVFAKSILDAGGKYGLINIPGIYFSLRRFKKEGFWTIFYKWHYFAYYYMRHGKFSEKIVPYEFGTYN